MGAHTDRRPAKLTVLTLLDRPSVQGGAERLACLVTMSLDPDRFDRIVCATRLPTQPTLVDELEAAGVEVLSLDRRGKLDLLAWSPLLRLLRDRPVHVLHAHMFGSNVWGTALGRLAGVPVIVAHEHTWSYQGQPLRRFLDRELIAKGASVFLAVSREDRRRMIEIEGVEPEAVRFLPIGIPALPAPSGRDVRAELGIGAGTPVVGTVCELRPQKALEVLLEAAVLLRGRVPGLRVVVAGDGPERERLAELVGALGLGDVVALLGLRRDVPDLLAAFDLCVTCSDFEGSPLAVMEYMAAGRPVVATRVGGVPDLVEDGVSGLLVPPRDPAVLAEAIAAVLADPELARRMGDRGSRRQASEFALDGTVRRLEDLYDTLFGAHLAAGR
jgi:glycosyltransferase involved in cell wall biosynthesis